MIEIVDMDGNPVQDWRFLTFREAEERFSEIPEEEAGRLFLSGGEMDGAAEREERGFYFIVVDFGDGYSMAFKAARYPTPREVHEWLAADFDAMGYETFAEYYEVDEEEVLTGYDVERIDFWPIHGAGE
jgi:hypothetical protein